MPISFTCPHCGKAMKAPDHAAGKRGKCPKCQTVSTVPKPARPPQEDPGYEVVEDVAPAAGGGAMDLPIAPSVWQGVQGSPVPPLEAPPPASVHRAAGRSTRRRDRPGAHVSSWREHAYWVLVLTLIPLGFSLLGGEDDTEERLQRTLTKNEQIVRQVEAGKNDSLDDLLNALPDGRIEGAHLPRSTSVHWMYAAAAAGGLLVLLLLFFRGGSSSAVSLVLVGLFTGTIGILLLLGAQWAAIVSGGVWLRGRGLVILVLFILKFIGFSYRAALDPENGFLLSFFGFTCGVGLCEELCKAAPIIFAFRSQHRVGGIDLDWRGACLWGWPAALASASPRASPTRPITTTASRPA